ncbi:hypothetical protein UCRPC4_g03490 [Phaeomoniella chlamydospora]|uniref:Uncharacterized protein n=1 Tax=Phaeomoniella chlamydospora TaxID=158046 RepID=A0A0G2GDJ7_PHACM|nr:hypothetical protein UCRPC4_g03490 [Phaeomoniella chlamydospora]
MAAPPEVNMKALSGKFVMNKTISDPFEPILALQGVSWLVRKGISVATITLHVNYSAGPPVEIKIIQTVTGGLKGTTEVRTLDFNRREHTDHVFGHVAGRTRYLSPNTEIESSILTKLADGSIDPTDVQFLSGKVLADGKMPTAGFLDEDEHTWIQSYVENEEAKWTAEQVWGFEEIEGKRMYTRRVVVRKGGKEVKRARLVYDYLGEVELTE